MNNLIVILLLIFTSVGLMVVLGGRFAKPADAQRTQKLSRWLMPLVGLLLVLSIAKHYFG